MKRLRCRLDYYEADRSIHLKWRVQRHPFPSLGVEFPLLVCVVQQPRRSASEKTRTRTRKRHLRHTGRGPRREEVEKEAERLTLTEAGASPAETAKEETVGPALGDSRKNVAMLSARHYDSARQGRRSDTRMRTRSACLQRSRGPRHCAVRECGSPRSPGPWRNRRSLPEESARWFRERRIEGKGPSTLRLGRKEERLTRERSLQMR